MTFKTEQEAFWAGDFGTEYIQRNQGDALLASNLDFFAKALRSTRNVKTCIEFGANIGMNLKALKLLHSILDFNSQQTWDLALIKGVLIHINPDELPQVYDKLVAASGKYMLVAEYYNPAPVAIPYRGHTDRLFKRDFAGEIMDHYPQMELIDYGCTYRRDPNFLQDDSNWFLMEKH